MSTEALHETARRMREPAGILLMLDDQPVDLSEVSWYQKAPCGCVSGVTVAFLPPDIIVTTAEQATASFYEVAHVRKKYVDLGFTSFPGRTSECREIMANDCPHEPKWGKPKRPQVEGHTWAAIHAVGSKPKLMHLVPNIGLENQRERRFGAGNTAALCGSTGYHWKDDWFVLTDKVECQRCWKRAES